MTQTPTSPGAGGTPAAQGQKASTPKHIAKFSGGTVVERHITKADFKAAGVEVDKDVVFSRANKHTVDVSDLSEEARDLLAKQPNIKISSKGDE